MLDELENVGQHGCQGRCICYTCHVNLGHRLLNFLQNFWGVYIDQWGGWSVCQVVMSCGVIYLNPIYT